MKKASASLVVLSIIFLISAALIYLFEYVSIERMMYINRSKAKKYEYNFQSIENIVIKDIESSYLKGYDISEFQNKSYNIFDGQNSILRITKPYNKDAFSIEYTETILNDKVKKYEKHYTILNSIFFDDKAKLSDKRKFYEKIKENEIREFTTKELNEIFIDFEEDDDKTFDFGKNIVSIKADDTDLNCNVKGQGILIIDGDINMMGSLDFSGLIIIDGKLVIKGTHNFIYGYIIDFDEKSRIIYSKSLAIIHDKCKAYKGIVDIKEYK